MIDLAAARVGDKVHYMPTYMQAQDQWQNGIIKRVEGTAIWVVYHCAGEWDRFQDYTGERTFAGDLFEGWRHESG
jgi:hypothetical protein